MIPKIIKNHNFECVARNDELYYQNLFGSWELERGMEVEGKEIKSLDGERTGRK